MIKTVIKKNSKVKNSFGTLPKPENSINGEYIKWGVLRNNYSYLVIFIECLKCVRHYNHFLLTLLGILRTLLWGRYYYFHFLDKSYELPKVT